MTIQGKKQYELINQICDRANDFVNIDKLSLFMNIDFAQKDSNLDLEKLLNFNDLDFGHDIYGIVTNLNRETKKLDNCFLPRSR